MKGLPPQPLQVVRLEQDFIVLGRVCSVSFWLYNPANTTTTDTWADEVFSGWFSTCLPNLLGLMHSDVEATTCRLSGLGYSYISNAPPNHGAWSSGTPLSAASGLKWTTVFPGRRGWTMTYVPGLPSDFVSNHWQLNNTGFGTLNAQGRSLYDQLNLLPSPGSTLQELVTLHRRTSAGPLAVAQVIPIIGVVPIVKVVTIARRIPSRGALQPL